MHIKDNPRQEMLDFTKVNRVEETETKLDTAKEMTDARNEPITEAEIIREDTKSIADILNKSKFKQDENDPNFTMPEDEPSYEYETEEEVVLNLPRLSGETMAGFFIRRYGTKDDIWYSAIDLCKFLVIKNVSAAIKGQTTKSRGKTYTSKGVSTCNCAITASDNTVGGRRMLIVNMAGINELLKKGNTARALEMKDYLYDQVLPNIQKTGKHVQIPNIKSAYDSAIVLREVVENYIISLQEQERLTTKVEEMNPKATFFDNVQSMDGLFDLADTAQSLNLYVLDCFGETRKDKKIGRSEMGNILRIMKVFKPGTTKPYHNFVDEEYFKLVQSIFEDENGEHVTNKTWVYPAGVPFIREKIIKYYVQEFPHLSRAQIEDRVNVVKNDCTAIVPIVENKLNTNE